MPNWTCYFTSTIKYHTLVLSQGTQLTVLTALLNNPVLWGQHSSMIVRSIDQCRCQKCMKYFGPSRRDQNNYRRIFFDNGTLETIRQPPTTTNNHNSESPFCARPTGSRVCLRFPRSNYWLLGRTYPCTVCRFVPKYFIYRFTRSRGVYENLVPPQGTKKIRKN